MKLTHDEVIKVVEYENNQKDSYYTYYTHSRSGLAPIQY